LGYKIIGTDDDIVELSMNYSQFFISIGHLGNPQKRINIYNYLIKLHVNIPTIISPYAYVSKHSQIGIGTIIMHHAVVNAGAIIGCNCILNTGSLIEHDAIVQDHCHISTHSIINGGVEIGEGTFFGSGATSKQHAKVAPFSFIKANSIVI